MRPRYTITREQFVDDPAKWIDLTIDERAIVEVQGRNGATAMILGVYSFADLDEDETEDPAPTTQDTDKKNS